MRADFHLHSTASDGVLSPARIIEQAAEKGVDIVALSDHDSVEGVAEAVRAGNESGVLVIPAVEFSAVHRDTEIHILGYGIDPDNDPLRRALRTLRENRSSRVDRIVRLLQSDGFDIDVVRIEGSSQGAIGRAHVARALVESGNADDMSDAFVRLIGEGAPYFISKEVLEVARVVELIEGAGGIPVLAHPWRSNAVGLIPELQSLGVRGVEAFHSEQTEAESAYLVGLAAARGLLVTGGSDWHGDGPSSAFVGSVLYPEGHLRRFLEVLGVDVDAC